MRALHEGDALVAVGDRDDDRGRLLAVRPPRDGLPRLHGAPHAGHAQRARAWSRPRSGKPILFFPARHDHWLVQTGDGWAAHVAGAIGVSTDAQASWWGGRGVGTVPHGLIAAYGGDTVRAVARVRRALRGRDERDGAGRLRQRLGDDRARGRRGARRATSGACGWTPPTSSPTARCSGCTATTRRRASRPSSSSSTREQLDAHGFRDVQDRRLGRLHRRPHPAFEADGRARRRLRRRLAPAARLQRLHRRRRDGRRPRRAGRSGASCARTTASAPSARDADQRHEAHALEPRGRAARPPSSRSSASHWSPPSSTGATSRPPGASWATSAGGHAAGAPPRRR